MPGRLYVVSTPIGNLDDITFRAVDILKSVGLIAAEDTRRTAILLRRFGIGTKATSLHEHNERQKLPFIIEALSRGVDVAVVSDAGTPLVADPGQRLVSAAIAAGIDVLPIPGPSAALAALAVSGFPVDQFVFCGFAPSRSSDVNTWAEAIQNEPRTIVFYDTPHRIKRTLAVLNEKLGNRPIGIMRELTKLHEQVLRTTADMVNRLVIVEKGEFTIVIGPSTKINRPAAPSPADVAAYFGRTTDDSSPARRKAVAQTAKYFGLTTNEVYDILERLKHDSPS